MGQGWWRKSWELGGEGSRRVGGGIRGGRVREGEGRCERRGEGRVVRGHENEGGGWGGKDRPEGFIKRREMGSAGLGTQLWTLMLVRWTREPVVGF